MAFHEPYYTTQSSPALAQYFQQHLEVGRTRPWGNALEVTVLM